MAYLSLGYVGVDLDVWIVGVRFAASDDDKTANSGLHRESVYAL